MADTLDVVALATAKDALRIRSGDTTKDVTLERLITGASRLLDRKVGPVVVRTVTAERHDGGATTIQLRHYPITSVTTIDEYASDGTVAASPILEPIDSRPTNAFQMEPWKGTGLGSGELTRRRGGADVRWTSGRQNIAVTYEAGRYATTAGITDQRYVEAAILILRNAWRAYQHGTVQVDEYEVPVETFPTFAVPKAVIDLLRDEWQGPEVIPGIA